MKIKSEELIQDLIERTRLNLNHAEKFKVLEESILNFKSDNDSWSILECFEHLNLYGDFYIPEIRKKMEASNDGPSATFKSGLLGNYFAKSMLPKEKLNKMKTFKDKNPRGSSLDKSAIEKFIEQQNQMLVLLKDSRGVNLTKIKTGITISNWIKLRLGDTFRVVIYHNDRHMVQASNVLETAKS